VRLAVVTCCRDYGRFLDDWARSLVALTVRPELVGIVDAGSRDDTPDRIREASAYLEAAGIRVETRRIDSRNLGTARNAAVEIADGFEWVQHFDVDDTAMPHMVADFAELADRADVIPAGYERNGNLAAGPRNRRRLYSSSRGASTLRSGAPASGVSPFRRSFWERSPYREDMPGGWDTALWIGFAHLDARFVPTRRPVFWYRQHAGSTFNDRRKNERRTQFVGCQLAALRRGDSGVTVLVPWQPDNGPRDAAWAWVRRRYEELRPDWQIVEGSCGAGEWRKGLAVQAGLAQARGDVLVIADADCVVDLEAIDEAIQHVRAGAAWAIPHRLVHRLDSASTSHILESEPRGVELGGRTIRKPYEGYAGGGVFVIRRDRYEASGGIPHRFSGWGAEDEALAVILDALIGDHVRLEADLWHLWHPPGRRGSHPRYQENALWSVLAALEAGATVSSSRGTELVRMIALESFRIGTRTIVRGQAFAATPEEVRRFRIREQKLAVERYSGVGRRAAELKAAAARIPDGQQRRLAMAGTRTRARAELDGVLALTLPEPDPLRRVDEADDA